MSGTWGPRLSGELPKKRRRTEVFVPSNGSHSAHRLAQFQILGAGVRLLHITSDYGVWIRRRMSCSYIHSSSKFSGTSPNVFKIVASPKFPIFGSPLRLNASAPALAGSRDIDSARRIAAGSLGISCA